MSKMKRRKERQPKEKDEKIKTYRRIITLYKERNYKAFNKEIKDFLNKYPSDELGWHYYAKNLMREERYEEALMIIENQDYEYNFMMKIDMVKCLIELERYEEAYIISDKLYYEARQGFNKMYLKRAIIYCLTRLGQTEEIDFIDLDYIEKQMISYDIAETIKHNDEENAKNDLFNENIDIEKLLEQVKDVLSTSKKLQNSSSLTDTYLYKYPNVGKNSKGEPIDILKVVTIHNTHDIVAIHPAIKVMLYPEDTINDWQQSTEKTLSIGKME